MNKNKLSRLEKEFDKEREEHLKASGAKILRFSNEQVLYEPDTVLNSIQSEAEAISK